MRDADPPTELQLAVLRALWTLGEAAVPEVQAHLGGEGRRLAPTTVATLLRRMEKKGWVHHREEGRAPLANLLPHCRGSRVPIGPRQER